MKRARRAKRRPPMPTALASGAVAAGRSGSVVVPVAPPRNPFAVHAHRRRAGAHGDNARTRRQAEKRALKKLLEE